MRTSRKFGPSAMSDFTSLIRSSHINRSVLLALLATPLLAPAGVRAQTAPQDTPASQGAKSADSGGIEVVLVTAEKRAQNLQTTSVSAAVLNQDQLDAKHIDNLEALQQVAPSLSVGEAGITASVNIRGIGLNISSPAVVMGVAVYRDGLFQPPILSSEPLFDMADVEVLRGPQGTFVGSSSTGGAIFYRSKDPDFDGLSGNVRFGYGNYNDVHTTGAINLPISKTLAARIAINYESRDSFFKQTGNVPNLHGAGSAFDRPGNLDQRNVRLGLKWEPNSHLTVLAKIAINRNNTGGLAHIMSTNNPYYDGRPVSFDLTYNVPNTVYDEKGERYLLQIDYKLDNGITFRSISGLSNANVRYVDDLDSSSSPGTAILPPATGVFNNQVHEWLASQEINILSPSGGRFDWIAGAFYFYDWALAHVGIDQPTPPTTVLADAPGVKEAIAGFGQVGYRIFSDLQIQAGLRYTGSQAHNTGTTTLLGLAPFPIAVDQRANESDTGWTGKISINWTITKNQYAYAFAAKGYKAGGINGPNAPIFAPEFVYDYEAGLKSSFFGSHVRTQIDGFYMDYRNLQLSSYIPPTTLGVYGGALGVANAGDSTIWGIEAQAQARFGELEMDANLSNVNSKLGHTIYINPNLLPGGGNGPLGPQCGTGVVSNPPVCFNYDPFTQDLSGRPNPYSPNWTANGGIEYDFNLGNDDTLSPRLDLTYISRQYQTVQGAAADIIKAHTLLNLSVTYSTGPWQIQGYVTNLTDTTYIVGQTYGPSYFLGPPRQFGFWISRSF